LKKNCFKVVPCWLASPESVSAIFPMEEFFDLVIFDEASQCFAERGIPALYRGKQAIIAGDAMQLKPGDFYQARWQDDEEAHADAEVDSLLDLCNRYLISTVLQGHYRSKP
jgi:superfamily I DNA and/or RNA helicase